MQDADVAKQAELTWPEFEEAVKKVAPLPVGVVEAHGPWARMPLWRCTSPRGPPRRPASFYCRLFDAVAPTSSKFPGTISISQETLYRLYKDVFLEAARNGVKYLVVVNGHGGNVDLLRTAAREVAKKTSLVVVLINWWVDLAKEARRRVLETPEGHATEDETSEVMAAYPHLVREVPREVDEWVEA